MQSVCFERHLSPAVNSERRLCPRASGLPGLCSEPRPAGLLSSTVCCNGLSGHDGNIITAWQCFSYPPSHSPLNVKCAQKHGIYGTGCDVTCYCWTCEPVKFGLFSTNCCAECIMSQRPHCSWLGVELARSLSLFPLFCALPGPPSVLPVQTAAWLYACFLSLCCNQWTMGL